MIKKDLVLDDLRSLGLTNNEAKVYVELLKKPSTHSQLSLLTGINRTTVYRLANSLKLRGFITQRVDDMGKFLCASDPSTLEVEVVTQEEKAKKQRKALGNLLPTLEAIKEGYAADFA